MRVSLLLAAFAAPLVSCNTDSIRIETLHELTTHLSNVHISYLQPVQGTVTYTYGPCDSTSPKNAYHHVGTTKGDQESRLVWKIPEQSPLTGCLSAWNNKGQLLGRSQPQSIHNVKRNALLGRTTEKSDRIQMTTKSGINVMGPWFDGVEHLSQKEPAAVNVEKAKSKEIAIVGAGMSGLMTYLALHQAGFTNISILEGGERLGGRVHTAYLTGGPFDYSYQEMGPMRFPYTWKNPADNKTYPISDHKLVFDLAKEMNKINGNSKNYSVDFIPWIQSDENSFQYFQGYKLPSGLPPTLKQIAQAQKTSNSSSSMPGSGQAASGSGTSAGATALTDKLLGSVPPDLMVEVANNIYKAHADFMKAGINGKPGDQWSEFGFFVNYLNGSLEDAAQVIDRPGASFWERAYGLVYGAAAEWRTIDGGLDRLPYSFYLLVGNITSWGKKIDRVDFDKKKQKVSLQWPEEGSRQSSEYDYAVVSVPFSVLRRWRLPSSLPQKMTDAVTKMPYNSACKVVLEYSERFWEKYDNPIFGGCGTTTDIPGIGTICYPSYNLNSTGPATIIASYVQDDDGERWACLSEEDHVNYVLDAMTEIHGNETRALYTGKYERRCWILDPLESGSWASPDAGQHELYIPEYFKTHDNMIFVGEHTAYTHAWIAAALESGIRGSVQLMLELGLVDEAKDTVNKWMARWIEV